MLVVVACYAAPQSPPPAVIAEEDPVAFILVRRDSLGLTDDVANQLVRLNTRLFRRNQPLRFTIDTLLERAGRRDASGRTRRPLPPDLQERVEPLLSQIRANAEAMRDTAYALLTEDQRARAEEYRARARTISGSRP